LIDRVKLVKIKLHILIAREILHLLIY
jgi:hypothetical protein